MLSAWRVIFNFCRIRWLHSTIHVALHVNQWLSWFWKQEPTTHWKIRCVAALYDPILLTNFNSRMEIRLSILPARIRIVRWWSSCWSMELTARLWTKRAMQLYMLPVTFEQLNFSCKMELIARLLIRLLYAQLGNVKIWCHVSFQNMETPLHQASDRCRTSIVELLLTYGADHTAVDHVSWFFAKFPTNL